MANQSDDRARYAHDPGTSLRSPELGASPGSVVFIVEAKTRDGEWVSSGRFPSEKGAESDVVEWLEWSKRTQRSIEMRIIKETTLREVTAQQASWIG